MRRASINISLPEELKEYIEEQTKAGESTPSEFVGDLIGQDRNRRARERLEQLLREGLESGEPIVADAEFWTDLKKEAVGRIASQKS